MGVKRYVDIIRLKLQLLSLPTFTTFKILGTTLYVFVRGCSPVETSHWAAPHISVKNPSNSIFNNKFGIYSKNATFNINNISLHVVAFLCKYQKQLFTSFVFPPFLCITILLELSWGKICQTVVILQIINISVKTNT